jgi:hypothetical protein
MQVAALPEVVTLSLSKGDWYCRRLLVLLSNMVMMVREARDRLLRDRPFDKLRASA